MYTGPAGFLSLRSKELGTGFAESGPYTPYSPLPCLAPMLCFISCSYRVYLGKEPEDWAVLGYTDINWSVDCEVNMETLQVAEIKSSTQNQSALKYGRLLVAGLMLVCNKILACRGDISLTLCIRACVCIWSMHASVCVQCTHEAHKSVFSVRCLESCWVCPRVHKSWFDHDNHLQGESKTMQGKEPQSWQTEGEKEGDCR